jgi:hypothetical protein
MLARPGVLCAAQVLMFLLVGYFMNSKTYAELSNADSLGANRIDMLHHISDIDHFTHRIVE